MPDGAPTPPSQTPEPAPAETPLASAAARPKRYGVAWAVGCLLKVLGVVFIVSLIALLAAWGGFEWWARRDTRQAGQEASLRVEIHKGDSLRVIARRLEKADVAGPAPLIVVLAVSRRLDRQLHAGRHAFRPGTPPIEVLRALSKAAPIETVRVTLPEGWTIERMADRLAQAGAIADRERFLRLCREPKNLRAAGIEADGAEGFLFPDTYLFERHTGEAEVIRRLAARLGEVVRSLGLRPGLNAPHAHALTYRESVILASIIEREARDHAEMPQIASVYHNRLRKRMPLMSCATVRFALGKWNARLTKSDLKTESPYNTYVHPGLPPAPICNPGRAAIDAAFRPAKSDFLYYVYKGNGRHAFSRTLREHERARRAHRDAWTFSAQTDGETD